MKNERDRLAGLLARTELASRRNRAQRDRIRQVAAQMGDAASAFVAEHRAAAVGEDDAAVIEHARALVGRDRARRIAGES